jgi:hypothetical protein
VSDKVLQGHAVADLGGAFHAAKFDEIGLGPSSMLQNAKRLGCLSPLGINLLQQRFGWRLTRFVAPTFRLNEGCAAVSDEADLCEEWTLAAEDHGENAGNAAIAFPRLDS